MAVVLFASATGSPGVTTTALATTVQRHRAALLIEADLSVTSSVLAGYFRGEQHHTHGLTELLTLAASWNLTEVTALGQRVNLGTEHRDVIPGFSSLRAGVGSQEFWGQLAHVLPRISDAEHDVFIDAGRWHIDDDRQPLANVADLTVFVLRRRLPDIVACVQLLQALTAGRRHALDGFAAVLVGSDEQDYTRKEIEAQLGIRVLADLPHDRVSAQVYSLGAEKPRRLQNRPLPRAITSLNDAIDHAIRARAEALAPQAGPDRSAR